MRLKCIGNFLAQKAWTLLVIFDFPFTHIRIHIKSPLLIQRYPLPRLLDLIFIQVGIYDVFEFLHFSKDFGVWVHDHRVSPSMVRSIIISGRTAKGNVDLVVHRPSTSLQGPVHRTRGCIKCTRVNKHEGSFSCSNHPKLREPDVIANC